MTATPRDNDAAANSRTGTGLRRFRKQQDRAGGPLYARARVERVRLDERYSYEQELSRNAFVTPTEPPRGRLQISVPYDGRDFLTRQACSDIEAGLAGEPGPDVREAQIGHLLLDNYDGTDLADVVNLIEPYGAMPILIPVGAAAADSTSPSRQTSRPASSATTTPPARTGQGSCPSTSRSTCWTQTAPTCPDSVRTGDRRARPVRLPGPLPSR